MIKCGKVDIYIRLYFFTYSEVSSGHQNIREKIVAHLLVCLFLESDNSVKSYEMLEIHGVEIYYVPRDEYGIYLNQNLSLII